MRVKKGNGGMVNQPMESADTVAIATRSELGGSELTGRGGAEGGEAEGGWAGGGEAGGAYSE